MKKFYLHIGLPRCASTTIETAFLMPDEEGTRRLTDSRVEPLRGLHDDLRAAAFEPDWTTEFRDQLHARHLADSLANPHLAGLFTSEESLSLTYSEEGQPPDLTARAQFMHDLLQDFETTIFVVIRNQVSYIESLYGLHLQHGGTIEFIDFVNGLAMDTLNWHAIIQTYADVFGKDRMIVVPLEPAVYANSSTRHLNFVDALQRMMMVTVPLPADDIKTFNPGLPRVLMPVQVQINQELDKASAIRVAEIIRTSLKKGVIPDLPLFGQGQQDYIKSVFAETNRKVFEDFMPDFDPEAYL